MESAPSDTEDLFFSEIDFKKIEWIEYGEEFELNGRLYDVSKIERTTKGFHIYCMNDNLEENFIAMFDQWKNDYTTNGNAKIIFQPQFCNQLLFDFTECEEVRQSQFSFDLVIYNSPIDQAPSPPPRQLS